MLGEIEIVIGKFVHVECLYCFIKQGAANKAPHCTNHHLKSFWLVVIMAS